MTFNNTHKARLSKRNVDNAIDASATSSSGHAIEAESLEQYRKRVSSEAQQDASSSSSSSSSSDKKKKKKKHKKRKKRTSGTDELSKQQLAEKARFGKFCDNIIYKLRKAKTPLDIVNVHPFVSQLPHTIADGIEDIVKRVDLRIEEVDYAKRVGDLSDACCKSTRDVAQIAAEVRRIAGCANNALPRRRLNSSGVAVDLGCI